MLELCQETTSERSVLYSRQLSVSSTHFFPDKIPYHCDASCSTAHVSLSYFHSCWQSTRASSERCGGGKGTISVLRLPSLAPHTNSNITPTAMAHSNTLTVGTNCSVTCQAAKVT